MGGMQQVSLFADMSSTATEIVVVDCATAGKFRTSNPASLSKT
jgi:hypothetical protein